MRFIYCTEYSDHELQAVIHACQVALRLAQTKPSYWYTAKISTLFNYISIRFPEVNYKLRCMIVYILGNFHLPKDCLSRYHLILECIETVSESSKSPSLKKFDDFRNQPTRFWSLRLFS